MATVNELLDAALDYVSRGWPVFPCKPDAKVPATVNGFKDATTDTDMVRRWWRPAGPDFNIGIATGLQSVDVLDVDRKPNGNGYPALNKLIRAGLTADPVALVRTPSGGAHLYFRPSGNGNHSLRRHFVDTRGDGGYVVAPCSVIGGRRYELLEYKPGNAGTLNWARCVDILEPRRAPRTQPPMTSGPIDGQVAALAAWLVRQSAAPGGRNNQLYWACCRAAEAGADDLTPLVEAAVTIGLTSVEALRTANSALRRGAA